MSNMVRRDQGGYGQRPLPHPQSGFYYSSRGGSTAAPSPSQHSYRSDPPSHMATPRQGGARGMEPRGSMEVGRVDRGANVDPRIDDQTPSYFVEHLATFAVGRQFGLVAPADGIRKLKQLEKSSAIWAQPMVLRFRPTFVSVEDENGDLVEQFPMELVEQPTAHANNDPHDAYNNILLFVVREDNKGRRNTTPTEMHIFQCNRVSAKEVSEDLQHYIRGQFKKVRNGRRSAAATQPPLPQAYYSGPPTHTNYNGQFPDDVSVSSETSEMFERDVNTLNRCFDDIERFVARTQSAALAQRELEQQAHRYRTAQRRDKRVQPPDPHGILQMRAQLPLEAEFVDVFRKFKLSFNLLAKLRNHIHEPNAPELVHFLFTPLSVILEASHWGIGRNIAPQVVSPLLSLEARELMQNCLNSKETDIWMSLGESWRTPPEDWPGPLPQAYRPVFIDGFAPYGPPETRPPPPQQANTIHRGQSEPPVQYRPRERERSIDTAPSTPAAQRYATQQRRPPQRNMSVDNLNLGRLSLEKEKIDFEKEKIRERQRRLEDDERRIRQERERLKAEQALLVEERKRNLSTSNSNLDASRDGGYRPGSMQPSPQVGRREMDSPPQLPMPLPHDPEQSPRQRAFVQDVIGRRSKLVQATYDRQSNNNKELTVTRGEYLEVINDTKNWWECKNMLNRIGYVPHTILSVVPPDGPREQFDEEIYVPSAGQMRMPAQSQMHNGNGHLPNGNISPGQSREIFVQHAGVQANVHQVVREPTPVVPVAPPISKMTQEIETKVLRKVDPQPERPRLQNPKMQIIKRRQEEDDLILELRDTVSAKGGAKLSPPKRTPKSSVHITERTSPDGVQQWLREKGFSVRLFDLLEGQDGSALFSLSRFALERAAGREEGGRLYSQILVEKSRSNYQTKSAAELKAILNYRLKHVELSNEAATEEPTEEVQLSPGGH